MFFVSDLTVWWWLCSSTVVNLARHTLLISPLFPPFLLYPFSLFFSFCHFPLFSSPCFVFLHSHLFLSLYLPLSRLPLLPSTFLLRFPFSCCQSIYSLSFFCFSPLSPSFFLHLFFPFPSTFFSRFPPSCCQPIYFLSSFCPSPLSSGFHLSTSSCITNQNIAYGSLRYHLFDTTTDIKHINALFLLDR